jgi:hypothetical protein
VTWTAGAGSATGVVVHRLFGNVSSRAKSRPFLHYPRSGRIVLADISRGLSWPNSPFALCHFTIIGMKAHRGFTLSPCLLGDGLDKYYRPERQRIREEESPAGFDPANSRLALSNSGSPEENLLPTIWP